MGNANAAAQIEADLRRWDAITLHRTATSGDRETALWLAEEIRKCGVTPELETFAFVQRVPGLAQVSDGTSTAVGLPMFDGGSTNVQGVGGKAGVLQSGSVIGVGHYGANDAHPATQALNAARRGGGHQAIVAIADVAPNVPGLAVLNAESYQNPFGSPVLQVATAAGPWLLAAAHAGVELTVWAELNQRATQASNVQAKILGRQPELAPLVIMTPRSGWWTCTSERGGGITVWLNALRHFAVHQPRRSVIFTANTGHELSHVGLDHYLHAHAQLVTGAHAWIHLGANFAASGGTLLWQASSQAYLEQGLVALGDQGFADVNSIPVNSRPLGEARNIYDGGGQFISLLGSNPLFHHPDDRWPQAIDMPKLVKLNKVILDMATTMAQMPG